MDLLEAAAGRVDRHGGGAARHRGGLRKRDLADHRMEPLFPEPRLDDPPAEGLREQTPVDPG